MTKYIVNKEKRTVVCIIETEEDVRKRLRKYNVFYPVTLKSLEEIRKQNKTYKGVAKCHPDDEKYGKRLAEYRASKLRKNDVNNFLNNYIEKMRKNLDNLEMYGMIKEPQEPVK